MKKSDIILLTIGSIILFNGTKQIVTHTYNTGNRNYTNINGKITDVTIGYHGFLKDIETGKETRSNWYNIDRKNILHFEYKDLVNPN